MTTDHSSSNPHIPLSSKQTLLCILLPMLGTFAVQRLYLHLVQVQHVYPGGYLVHHLFWGILMVIPSAFLLAFETRNRRIAVAARLALGIGSAMVLDEIVYLVMTKASDSDYVSPLSFWGAVIFISLGVVLLLAFYKMRCGKKSPPDLANNPHS